MQVFRNAVIPSSTSRARSPPPPPRPGKFDVDLLTGINVLSCTVTPGRPPPDYGPYQGPGGRRGRY